MKSSEQIRLLEQANRLLEKNQYTQSSLRLLVDKGYSDCSSFVWWLYLYTLKIDIGMDTPEQILSLKGLDIEVAQSEIPDVTLLAPGDLLFFKGADATRPFTVGHVEMYLGNGKIIGHNEDTKPGPTIKNLEAFCRLRAKKNREYIKTRRFIL